MLNYSNIHSVILNSIKKNTGCSFLAFERYKDRYQVRAVKNKKEKFFLLNGTPNDIKPDFYLELENMINAEYE
jgi:hypothetical protein